MAGEIAQQVVRVTPLRRLGRVMVRPSGDIRKSHNIYYEKYIIASDAR